MATTWTVTLLLVGYFSVYDGVEGRFRSYRGYTSYRSYRGYTSYRTYGTSNYCSSGSCGGTTFESLAIGFAPVLIVLLGGLIVLAICCCCKKKTKPERVVGPSPPSVTSSGNSRDTKPSNEKKPTTHDPKPSPVKDTKDPPPPYNSLDPAHPPGQSSNKGQINTRKQDPGTTPKPPSVPTPAWQAPPPGAPPQSDNPPMPQPDPPKTSSSNEAVDLQSPVVVTARRASGIQHSPPPPK